MKYFTLMFEVLALTSKNLFLYYSYAFPLLLFAGKTIFGTLLEEGIISMGLSQKVKGVFNHKGWFQWTFNFMLRKII